MSASASVVRALGAHLDFACWPFRTPGIVGRRVDVVVGTPGRVLDMIKVRELDVSHVKQFILDKVVFNYSHE